MDTNKEKCSGVTRIETLEIEYDWIIYNVDLCGKQMGEFIESPIFSFSKYDEYKWSLQLYPKGYVEKTKDYISIFLKQNSKKKIDIQYQIYIITSTEKEVQKFEYTYFYNGIEVVGCPKWIKQDELKSFIFDNKFVIRAYLTAGVKIENHLKANSKVLDKLQYNSKIHDELDLLLQNKNLTDITLVAGGEEFHAHKAVLAARSPVFLAMFETDMKEKTDNKIEFSDLDSNVLNEMLRYIYAGKVKNIEKCIQDLLLISDKYALDGLKIICEKYLYNKISVINVLETLILADRYNCEELKTLVVDYIDTHKEVMDSSEFKMLKKSHTNLVCDVLLEIVSKSNKNSMILYFC